MKHTDIIAGQIYKAKQSPNHSSYSFIVKEGKIREFMDPIGKSYTKGYSHYNCTDYTPATKEETFHLEACIKANKYVEAPKLKPEIINEYQIY